VTRRQSSLRNKVRRQRRIKKEPERCPVCEGRGVVPYGFYGDQGAGTGAEPCRSCGGTGIVTAPVVMEQEKKKGA
jgi:DnaJ-class molecular chaperone